MIFKVSRRSFSYGSGLGFWFQGLRLGSGVGSVLGWTKVSLLALLDKLIFFPLPFVNQSVLLFSHSEKGCDSISLLPPLKNDSVPWVDRPKMGKEEVIVPQMRHEKKKKKWALGVAFDGERLINNVAFTIFILYGLSVFCSKYHSMLPHYVRDI